MWKYAVTMLALASLSLGVSPPQAQAGGPGGNGYPSLNTPQYVTGTVYDPELGNVTYLYYPATGYFYVPALRSGIFLNNVNPYAPMSGSYRSPYANSGYPDGLWRQGNTVGQTYRDGSFSYRNSTTGMGAIIDPSLGVDGIWISPR